MRTKLPQGYDVIQGCQKHEIHQCSFLKVVYMVTMTTEKLTERFLYKNDHDFQKFPFLSDYEILICITKLLKHVGKIAPLLMISEI